MPDQIVACMKLNVSLSANEVDRGDGIETVHLRETYEIGFDPESASIVALDVAFRSLR